MRLCQTSSWDRAIVSELTPGIESLRILDVGCATGRLLCKLAEAGARHLSGVDLAPRIIDVALQKLRDHGFEAELKSADVEVRVPWPHSWFDVVTLTGVLHHFFRPDDAVCEINRVLRCNGRIIIVDPWFPSLLRPLVNLYLRFFSHDGDCHFYSPTDVAQMLERHGWCKTQYHRVGRYSFMVSGPKEKAEVVAKRMSRDRNGGTERGTTYEQKIV